LYCSAIDPSLVVLKDELGKDLVDCIEVFVEPSEGVSFAALRIVVKWNADTLRGGSGEVKKLFVSRILDAMNLLEGGKDAALSPPDNKLGTFGGSRVPVRMVLLSEPRQLRRAALPHL
jgi:hypothetical protein